MTSASRQLIIDFNLAKVTAPIFFRSIEEVEDHAGRNPFSHFMRRAWETMHLNGILCVEGRPTVYFKEVERIDSHTQRERYKKFWNQGLATLLVVRSPSDVQVFSSLANPIKSDSDVQSEHRLVEILNSADKILRFVDRVQTGQIYRDSPDSFQPDKTVDKFLLKNLREARNLLHKHNNLDYKIVHPLLGRIIFTCYLVERGIIEQRIFDEANLSGTRNLHDLLSRYDGIQARNALYRLFEVLKKHFNSSMFDETLRDERDHINGDHITILRRFLSGDELNTDQRTFDFWAYDFSVIPVETISSIYEEFLAEEDQKKQKLSGAYYTPKHLAEMVVDVATQGTDLLGKRILDPACGSGIFLVILFNRIAELWRRENPRAQYKTRAENLLEIIRKQLCGIDVNLTACRIACFSLYIAFLDQLNPREIKDLEEKRGQILDNFLAIKKDKYKNTNTPVIYEGNFFDADLPIDNSFDIVIGNPPWVSRGNVSDPKAIEWCLSDNNPYLEIAPKTKADKERFFQPAKQIAHSFMWKAPVHLTEKGKVCFVLPTKVLFNNKTDLFQAGWFNRFTVEKVIQLSDWRYILFENAICPAVVIRFESRKPDADYSIVYEVPKVNDLDPRRGVINLLPEDLKTIKLSEIKTAADRQEISIVWKKRSWGTRRDVLLIDRLLEMPRLGDITGKPEKPNRFISGQGFQPYLPEYYDQVNGKLVPKKDNKGKEIHGKPKPIWWPKDYLYVDASNPANLILTRDDCDQFRKFKFRKNFFELRRSPEEAIYTPPAVIITKGFSKSIFYDFPVVFNNTFQAISGNKDDTKYLMFLSAVLNSSLAKYYFFHVPANVGVERTQVFVNEIDLLPFPLPENTDDPQRSIQIIDLIAKQMVELKAAIEKNYLAQEKQTDATMRDIEYLVYEYYGISEREQMLIENTVTIFKQSMMPSSISGRVPTIGEPTSTEKEEYVDLLCDILNSWAKRSKFRVSGQIENSSQLGLSLITLIKGPKKERTIQTLSSDELQEALARIQKLLPAKNGRLIYHRNLKVFDEDKLYILKRLSRRHWTKTAAINDADEIAAAMLTSGESR
jgi:hypothetical protein